MREMRRVLLPEGRVAIGTWRPLAELAMLRELHPIAEQQLGSIVDARHSFGDADGIAQLLTDAGFRDIQVETISHSIRMSDGTIFARLNATALASMSEKGKTMVRRIANRRSNASSVTAPQPSRNTPRAAPSCSGFPQTSRLRRTRNPEFDYDATRHGGSHGG
jgi:hypothetical protein